MSPKEIPDVVVNRLALYLRALTVFSQEERAFTSSQELGAQLEISPAQIRKDLSYFGEFGKQGMGYEIEFLISQLKRILQANRRWDIALVGAGDLGRALVGHEGLRRWNLHISAVFDRDPDKIGQVTHGQIIEDVATLKDVVSSRNIRLGIIAVPAEEAQSVADQFVEAGVKAILNYAPASLKVPEGVRLHNTDPVVGMQSLAYYLSPDEG